MIVDGIVNTQIVFATESGINSNTLSSENVIRFFDIRYGSVAKHLFVRIKKEMMQRRLRGK